MERDLLLDVIAKDRAFQAIGTAAFSTGEISDEAINALAKLGANEPDRVLRAAGRVAHRLLNNVNRIPELSDAALSRILSSAVPDAFLVHDLIAYLAHLKSMDKGLKKLGLDKARAVDMAKDAETASYLLSEIEETSDRYPSIVASMLWQFKNLSLSDRDAARNLYKQLQKVPTFLEVAHEGNIGLATYFNKDEIPKETVLDRDFCQKLTVISEAASVDVDTFLLLSVDPHFLRHHGASWLNWAPFLQTQKIGLLFIVTGDKSECEAAISEARDLLAAHVRFHGASNPDVYAKSALFIYVEVPSNTSDIVTFYACARYLFLPEVLDALGRPVLVVDVDMAIRSDLRLFLKDISEADFACPFSRGIEALYPWRRYMAGTGYFNGSMASRLIAADISKYVRRGLHEPRGWTLDQNALAFAIENARVNGANIFDVCDFTRPLFQEKSRIFFERIKL